MQIDSKTGISSRIIKDRFFKALVISLSFFVTIPFFFILFYIFKNGIASISWEFIVNLPKPVGETGGGIANAIAGTVLLIALSCATAVPLGVAAGVFLSEYKNSKLAEWLILCVAVLQGIPSIVIGIIAYTWIVIPMRHFSGLAGAIALGIMMLPVIIKSTEETLKLIPDTLKEASLALGVPYHKTILMVILPAGLSGIVTGILLSIARIAGETAPLLFTAFGSQFMSLNVLKPINALPLLIFNYANSPYSEWHSLAWGASFVLITLVLVLNLTARLVTKKWKVQF